MSDTDDTDILLLIPPKFFTVPDQEIGFEDKSTVDTLISQVNNLEDRVNVIENFTSSRCSSYDEDYGESHKVRVKDKETFLKEIDGYLESVKNKEKKEIGMENDKIMESLFHNGSPSKRLALPEVDRLLREMEITQNEIENKLKSREIEYGLNKEKPLSPRKTYLSGDNIGSVPDLGYGVRDMFATPSTSPLKATLPPKAPSIEEPFVKRDEYLVGSSNPGDRRSSISSSFTHSPRKDVTKIVTETRRYGNLSPRRRLQMTPDSLRGSKTDINKLIQVSPENQAVNSYKPDHHIRNNLVSLADLWKSDGTSTAEDPSKLRQKLEEEKYRRLHLENLIQTLNRKVLEEQEKLAVAMKVDEGKDRAIGKITDAWKQMVEHWKEIEAERHAMSQKLISEKASIKKSQDDINKKIDRWEKEVSQALDLAAGFKGKCEYLEAELTITKESSEGRIKELEEKLESKESSMKNLLDERAKLMEKLRDSEEDYENEKKLVEMARNEVEITQKNLYEIEAELSIVKEQKDSLSMRLKEEKGRSQNLEQQKNQLQGLLTESKEKQTLAEDEAKTAREQLDKAKTELRTLYQSQLESVVRDKLAEFQSQLDAAQASMQAEIENTKKIAQQRSEQQRSALVNSHLSELKRLETVHKEEVKAITLKLAESEKKRLRLENGKKDIAQKLHGVMETQWQQALSIITSELSMRQSDPEHQKGQGDNTSREQPRIHKEVTESDETPRESYQPKLSLSSNQDHHLLKYIQKLLEKQPGKPIDTSSSLWQDTSHSDIPESSFSGLPWHQIISSTNGQNDIQDIQQNRKPPWK